MVNTSTSKGNQVKIELLQALEASQGCFVSGEELGRHLGVSRTSVWKHIRALRRQGYVIESLTRQGHRLLACPDSLHPVEIKKRLKTEVLGRIVHYFPKVDSTQSVAFQLAQKGAAEGTVVVAEEQTGGRGRLGRSYFSPRGGVWFSFILRPPFQPQFTLPISLMAGVALAEALKEATGLPLTLKWPNDILIGDKKVAGILAEMVAETDKVSFVVCGIGINVNIKRDSFPEELRPTATSLSIELGQETSRVDILCQVLERLDRHYSLLLQHGPPTIIEAWRRLPNMLGKQVRFTTPEGTLEGKAVDLDDQGALLVQIGAGLIRQVLAGDIYLLKSEYQVREVR